MTTGIESSNSVVSTGGSTKDLDSRSIIVGGITVNLALEKLIKSFQSTNDVKIIENVDVYDYDKIRLIYINEEEANKTLKERGPRFELDNIPLTLSKVPSRKLQKQQLQQQTVIDMANHYPINSYYNYVTAEKSVPHRKISFNLDSEIDTKRVVLTNIPKGITYEHLLLYLEYLSDEVGIERVDDAHKDFKNSIVVKFVNNIDFSKMIEKHSMRPKFLEHKTELLQISEPRKVVVEFNEYEFNEELLDLYFSNKKRSGGENVKRIEINREKTQAIITFQDTEVARKVANQKHQIDKKPIKVRVLYEKISEKSHRSSPLKVPHSPTKKQVTDNHGSFKQHMFNSELLGLEKSFDPRQLTEQQKNYLIGLQSIYNELSDAKLDLFKSSNDTLTEENRQKILQAQESTTDDSSSEIKIKVSQPSHDPSDQEIASEKIYPIEKTSSKQTISSYTYMGTESTAEKDAIYASSVIDSSFKSCFESLDASSKIICDIEKAETKSTRESVVSVKSQAKEKSSSVKNESEVTTMRESKTGSVTSTVTSTEKKSSKQSTDGSKDKTKRALVPLRLARRAQLSKKNKNKEPLVVNKNRLSRPPMPKIVKSKDELDILVDDLSQNQSSQKHDKVESEGDKSSGRSHSTHGNANYYSKSTNSFDDTLITKVKLKDRTFSEIGSRRSRDSNLSPDMEDAKAKFEKKRADMSSLPDLTKAGVDLKKNLNHFKVDLAKKNFQSFYGKDTLSSSIDKLTPIQLDFFRNSKYLSVLAGLFPKVKCNLNEILKNIYFFGSSAQVLEAKSRVTQDISVIKEHKFKLENKEVAVFLKKTQVKQKILKFIETIMSKNNYSTQNKKTKAALAKNESLVNYCTYDVGSEVIVDLKNQQKKVETLANNLLVSCNVEFGATILKKFIDDSISVNKVHSIKSKRIAEYIIYSKPDWTNFYENNYRNSIDFVLKEKVLLNKAYSKTKPSNKSWELRLTGFNEDISKFIEEFDKKFKSSRDKRQSAKDLVKENKTK